MTNSYLMCVTVPVQDMSPRTLAGQVVFFTFFSHGARSLSGWVQFGKKKPAPSAIRWDRAEATEVAQDHRARHGHRKQLFVSALELRCSWQLPLVSQLMLRNEIGALRSVDRSYIVFIEKLISDVCHSWSTGAAHE